MVSRERALVFISGWFMSDKDRIKLIAYNMRNRAAYGILILDFRLKHKATIPIATGHE